MTLKMTDLFPKPVRVAIRAQAPVRDWQARVAGPAAFVEGAYSIPGLKHVMDVNGYYGGPPRLPLTVPAPEVRGQAEEAFQDLRG